jgi:hypothetical protein
LRSASIAAQPATWPRACIVDTIWTTHPDSIPCSRRLRQRSRGPVSPALPEHCGPTGDEIANAKDKTYREFLLPPIPAADIGKLADIVTISVKGFERKWLRSAALPEDARPRGPDQDE